MGINQLIRYTPCFLLVLFMLAACSPGRNGSGNSSGPWDLKLSRAVTRPPAGMEISGNPQIVLDDGRAVRFDGQNDGIFYDRDPVAGWDRFSIEMIFRPDSDGPFAQRIINLGSSRGPRVLVEIRNTGTAWYLDAFMASLGKLTLVDSSRLHPTGRWYEVTLTADHGKMHTFVNGVPESSGAVAFTPLPEGKSSFGTRLNHKYWFKGEIREIRISPFVVDPAHFLRVADKDHDPAH
jgi:hypothetical protein